MARSRKITQKLCRLDSPQMELGADFALQLLWEAHRFANDLRRNPWEFAVDIQSFRAVGVSGNTLRWLVCMGHAKHAIERLRPRSRRRVFCQTRNLAFTEESCFVLTELGASLLGVSGRRKVKRGIAANGVLHREGPHWDRIRRELRLGGVTIKQFKVPAHDQELLLAGFEELGWPARMDDPLSPNGHRDPKSRLHDAIKRLNQHQSHRLIRFRGDGTGRGISWEFVTGTLPESCP